MALVAAVIAVAALVVGIIGLFRPSSGSAPATSIASPTRTAAGQDTSTADHALCTAIAPLMADYDRTSNNWTESGEPGTPARDAALPKYRSDTEDWARRIQDALDAHPDADPFLKRTLQRYIDDRILLVRNIEPGPSKPTDDEAWSDSMTAYEGPVSVCWKLGVKW
nr:hypothetical protein [Mycobacterium sp. JS623]